MSLRKALEGMPSDREIEATLREVLAFLRYRPGEQFAVHRIARATGRDDIHVRTIVEQLAQAFVVDFDGASDTCAYRRDTLLDVEIDHYIRRTEHRVGRVQNNVERFRQRYGDR